MEMKMKKTAAVICAAIMSLAALTACDSSENKEKSDSKTKTESKAETSSADGENSVLEDKKVEVYLNSDGTPYYIDEDGQKWMLFSTQMNEEGEEQLNEYIYDRFDLDGLSFDIPDGWFADAAYGYGMMFKTAEEEESINYDESIAILSTTIVFPELEGDITEDFLKGYYDGLVEEQFYSEFEITETGTVKVCGVDSPYFDLTVSYSRGEDENGEESFETFRTKYIVTPGDNSHCIVLSSYDDDESFKTVNDAFLSIADTIVLPTAEEMGITDEEAQDGEDIVPLG